MSLGWISRVSALFAVTCLPSVLAIQPSADYGQYKTPNLYNCSGANPTSALTATNSADTLPQIQPLSSQGWEQWEFFLHGTFPIILRWSQGDQSQADATPANGKIEIAILGVNGTNVETSVTGPLSYTSGDVNQITIGNNIFKWDSESLWYNVTLSAEGYTLVLDTYSAILDTFHPNVEQYNGLLSSHGPALYGSVPVTRGQSMAVGNVITEFTDLGGGKTTYYNVSQGFTLASYDGGLVNGTIAGMYQVYEAPLLNDS
ncbi:hypothetical protein BKA82DRAFT_948431 [Pisolithus tinctorius]|uniref:Uncharacterized protein n=1 Tax=Pisolithus tinctorius Marx 270 TaxID=870435 RepID=A0A0C3PC86_PISTI|nr:hypothetical protein BKA82DRAFT_948431 [Pisolithus tinctorius]KIO05314.1 hypothetical protein M404DRAFT_948431 [Pisolithus tinctorius Marx 270]